MDKDCSNYEALFVFKDDEECQKHLQNCPQCQKEHEKMQKVSELIQQVKPYFKKKQRNWVKLKAACALFVIVSGATTLGLINFNTDISDTLKYGTTLSAEDLGFPVDSYGLIYIE